MEKVRKQGDNPPPAEIGDYVQVSESGRGLSAAAQHVTWLEVIISRKM